MSRRRETDEDVAGTAMRADLAREQLLAKVVVADGRQRGAVGGQRERGQRPAIEGKPSHELRREMLCRRGAPLPASGTLPPAR
jgi:hypothetical protein